MKRLFNNTTFSFIDYVVLVGLNLAATPLLLRDFGIDGYGAFIFLNMFSIYGALAVFDLGMEGSLMNYIARFQAASERRKMHAALTVSLLYYAAIGLAVAALLYLGSDLLASKLLDDEATINPDVLSAAILIVSVNAFFQFLVIPVTAALQGIRKYVVTKGVSSLMNVTRYVLLVAVAIMFHRIDVGFLVVLGGTLIRLVTLTGILFLRTPEFRGWRPELDWPLFRTLFSYSSLLFTTRVIGLIYNHSPKVFIWYFMSVATMTLYDVVVRPAMLLRTILGVIVSAVIPEVARLHEKGETEAIARLYVSLVRYSYMLLLPLLAVLFVHIENLIGLWVGYRFEAQAHLALILLVSFLVFPISAVANTMVVGLERVKQTIWIPIVGTSLNIVLSLVLLQSIGLSGILIGTLSAQLFSFIPYALFMTRFLGFRLTMLLRPLIPVFLLSSGSAVVNAGVKFLVPDQAGFLVSIGAATVVVCYVASARYLLTSEERSFVFDRFRDIRSRVTANNHRSY